LIDSPGLTPPLLESMMPVQLPDAHLPYRLSVLNEHPDYLAAKSGDEDAALRLAQDLLSDKVLDGIYVYMKGAAHVTIVPVLALEALGHNKIPLALSLVLEARMGWQVSLNVYQAERVHRTQLDGLGRLFARPSFAGVLGQAHPLLLLDDTLTQGGTFAALEAHLRAQGAVIAGVVALTGKLYSAPLRLEADMLRQLEERFDDDFKAKFRARTGYGFSELTQSEGRALAHAKVERLRAYLP